MLREHVHECAELGVVGERRRHRAIGTVVVEVRRREAERRRRAGTQRAALPSRTRGSASVVARPTHCRPSRTCAAGCARPCPPSSPRSRAPASRRVPGPALPRPRDADVERLDRHVFDVAEDVDEQLARSARTGARESEQFPSSTVVTPCCGMGSAPGSQNNDGSRCVWVSMNPGVTSVPTRRSQVRRRGVGRRRSPRCARPVHARRRGACGTAGAVDQRAAVDQQITHRVLPLRREAIPSARRR